MQHTLKHILLFSLFLFASIARACTCASSQGQFSTMRALAEWEISQASVLFEGEVQNIEIRRGVLDGAESPTEMLSVTLKVMKGYKGLSKETVTILTGTGGDDCGFEFEIGQSYFVEARQDDVGKLFTNICQATEKLSVAGPYLRILQNQPAASDDLLTPRAYWEKVSFGMVGKICGSITHQDNTAVTSNVTGSVWHILNSPVSPIKYGDLDIKTPGSFCTSPLPPGRYVVGAEDGEPWTKGIEYRGYYPYAPRSASHGFIEVHPEETVSNIVIRLTAHPVYTINGRVTGAREIFSQVEDMRVILHSSENELADPEETSIEPDGKFEFHQIPPGRYLLYIVKYGKPNWKAPTINIDVPKQLSGIVLAVKDVP